MPRPGVILLVFACFASAAIAHPVPKDNHDRTAVVRVGPAGLRVALRFEVDETTAALDLARAGHPGLNGLTRERFPSIYADYLAARLPDVLLADLGDRAVVFRVVGTTTRTTDHLRCEFALEAPWPQPLGDEPERFVLRDSGWENDDASRIALSLEASPGVELLDAEVPDAALIARPSLEWRPGDGERRRTLRATLVAGHRDPPGRYRPTLPPDPEPLKPPAQAVAVAGSFSADLGEGKAGPGWAVAKSEDAAPTLPEDGGPPTARPATSTLRGLLLDSNLGFGMLLVLAALFGAAHALTPGHGKTMVAAYLVGERGTVAHAILLGIVTTLTHTAAVLVLAALLPLLVGSEQRVQTALEFVGGLLIAALGIWLLLRRLMGRADHVHLFGDHSHGSVAQEGTPVRWLDLILLGMAGGIIPCWDAIAMLGLAIASGQLWLGFPLLLAFSAGLAFVLVAIGIGVVATRHLVRPRLEHHRDALEVIGRVLPLITAVVIAALGLWLCYEALHGGYH